MRGCLDKTKDKSLLPELGFQSELLNLSRCCQVQTVASIAKAEGFGDSKRGVGVVGEVIRGKQERREEESGKKFN